jgi:hypothetical protein
MMAMIQELFFQPKKMNYDQRNNAINTVAELVDKYRRGQAMYIFLCLTSLLPKLKWFYRKYTGWGGAMAPFGLA